MKILFLGLGFANMNKSTNLFTELVTEFHNNGHHIDVVAPELEGTGSGRQLEAGINVIRVPTMKLFNVGLIQKGLANLLLPYQFKKALKRSGLDLAYDLVIMPTPPITLVVLTAWFKRKYNSQIYVMLRDIFPQNAVDLKMMSKSSIIYSYFRRKEKKMYRIADAIGCMSQGNIDYVLQHNPWIEKKKLHILPNSRNLKELLRDKEINSIKKKYNLMDKFIVFFGGNIGRPQKIENIVALAKSCASIENLCFFIVGDGNEGQKLRDLVQAEQLENVQIHGKVTSEDYHRILQAADVGLISLSEDFTIPNIPSKTLSYFNAKKPILASIDVNTDYGTILEESGAGIWREAGKTEQLKEALLYLMDDDERRIRMGQKGYEYMKNNLTANHAYRTLISKIQV